MDSTPVHLNLRMSHMLALVTCLLCVLPLAATAYSIPAEEERAVASHHQLSKRDVYMGLKLNCELDPRNCPGGLMLSKKSGLLTALLSNSPSSYSGSPQKINTAYSDDVANRRLRMMEDLVQLQRLIDSPSAYAPDDDETRLYK